MLLLRSVDPMARGIFEPTTAKLCDFSVVKKEIWSDVFSWGLYERVGELGQHCRNYLGGFMSNLVTRRNIEFWLVHILLIAVRFENEVVGPHFLSDGVTNQS
ncbi:hypothetical protein Plhal304r1_c027g0091051 [Plasmopara halstedii]